MADNKNFASTVGEVLARRTDRRTFLGKASQYLFAGAAAVTMGAGARTGSTYAAALLSSCSCSFPGGVQCSNCPGAGGCPSGCSFCTKGQHSSCPHTSGYWTSPCGSCFYYCSDCWCGGSQPCGCKSVCIDTLAA